MARKTNNKDVESPSKKAKKKKSMVEQEKADDKTVVSVVEESPSRRTRRSRKDSEASTTICATAAVGRSPAKKRSATNVADEKCASDVMVNEDDVGDGEEKDSKSIFSLRKKPRKEHHNSVPKKDITSTTTAGAGRNYITMRNGVNTFAPTMDDLATDVLSQMAKKNWGDSNEKSVFSVDIVDRVYSGELARCSFCPKRVMLLEVTGYLERYLWPHYTPEASLSHVMSIVVMVNEKAREGIAIWTPFTDAPEHFESFFEYVLRACTGVYDSSLSIQEHTFLVLFLINCFKSLENELIRKQIMPLVALPIWEALLPGRREAEMKSLPKVQRHWKHIIKQDNKIRSSSGGNLAPETLLRRFFIRDIVTRFLGVLGSIPGEGNMPAFQLTFCERFLELLIDIESQLPTRRYVNTLLDDMHVVVKCRMAPLTSRRVDSDLFVRLLDSLAFYTKFEISDFSGTALSIKEITNAHYDRFLRLQRVAFKTFCGEDELKTIALSSVASCDSPEVLRKHLERLSDSRLQELGSKLNYLPSLSDKGATLPRDFMLRVLVARHERHMSQLTTINNTPLYPTEAVLWDPSFVPSEYFSGETCLALPKLNLQFLTLYDYFLRNYTLFRLESTFEIRNDIETTMERMQPRRMADGSTVFEGWSRSGVAIDTFIIVDIARPKLGESKPARVRADVTIDLRLCRDRDRAEWESLRQHDVIFLMCAQPTLYCGEQYDRTLGVQPQLGIRHVRGAEVVGMLDISGEIVDEFAAAQSLQPVLRGDKRTYRLLLDASQYKLDSENAVNDDENIYVSFNVMMRRDAKANNFKAVLETIRDLMNTHTAVPEWLHDVFLGYGDPGAAHYSRMPSLLPELNFNDTFIDALHVRESFPNYTVSITDSAQPPFCLKFDSESKSLTATSWVPPNPGPYPADAPRHNSVRFTPTQIEAIRSGMQPGLSLVVGPPGTGKTDVAVQIVSNLYHNFPEQRTLIVTHSNQALNALFEKIMGLNIDERHLLRLGRGHEELDTEKDFGRLGRTNFVLERRLHLLGEVSRLAESLGVRGKDASSTCETAGHFHHYHILARWEEFRANITCSDGGKAASELVKECFPFHEFFSTAPDWPHFLGESYAADLEVAEGCWRHLERIFTELEEYRPFELLRRNRDRNNYLLVKEARIIAMTCTHAALKRRDLLKLGFKYDNVLMEEAAQILEIETIIPFLSQNPEDGHSRLRRIIMIGDHHQLPPVVQNMAFQKFSNMEQSLFARFVRLGVPTINLDLQGRARSSLASLYSWRYANGLGDLPHIQSQDAFRYANAGFRYDYQFVDVGDFNGVGESEPTPHFLQNLAEAEYIVATYMYMRMLGYPAESISVLTTYNGQRALLNDVLSARCAGNPLFGMPRDVVTVDKFQGQQNIYVLLSLVRTRSVGYVRDVRRLVVALSRARLGLYVFGRRALFESCLELKPAFDILLKRPDSLVLASNEAFPASRLAGTAPNHETSVPDMPSMVNYVDTISRDASNSWRAAAAAADIEHQIAEDAASKSIREAKKKAAAEIRAQALGGQVDRRAEMGESDDDDSVDEGADK